VIDAARIQGRFVGDQPTLMRFVLAAPEKRLFVAERYCFRGSVDKKIRIGGVAQKLAVVLKKFFKRLGNKPITGRKRI
jgi:hypothetical protein